MCVLLVALVLIPLFSSRTALVYMYFWAFPSPRRDPSKKQSISHVWLTNIQCVCVLTNLKKISFSLEHTRWTFSRQSTITS